MDEEHYIVTHPKIMALIGIVVDILLAIILVNVTFSLQMSDIVVALVFYSVLGLCFWGGLYLILISVKCKLIVNGKEITVVSIFIKPYTFLVGDIVSVIREEKTTHYGDRERIVIKTKEGRRIKVESSQESYEKFIKTIKSGVMREYLVGFNNETDEDNITKNPSLIKNHIIESIKILASTPSFQLSLFPEKITEIVFALDEWLLVYENDSVYRYNNCFSKNEYKLISDLNNIFNDFDDELWTECAIKTSEKWEEIRILARDVLSTLGVEYHVPEDGSALKFRTGC